MEIDFANKTEKEKDKLIGEGYFLLKEKAVAGVAISIVDCEAKDKPLIKTNDKRVFIFEEANKHNLMNIRANVGKEIDRRLKLEPFENFKIAFAYATKPSDEQRGYYYSVVLPTIQEHFKQEGNFMKENDLHEAIKNAIENEEGLTTEKVNPITGAVYQSKITISNAGNKKETALYIDAVIRFAAGYGIAIPEANINNKK